MGKVPELKDHKKNFDHKSFSEFVKQTKLKEIYLTDLVVELKKRNFLNPKVAVQLRYKTHLEGKTFIVSYILDLKVRDGKTVPLKIKVTYQLEYDTTFTDPPEEFLEKYSDVSSKMQVWPYFREIVSNLISRMGLPPMTLPVISFIPE